MENPALILMDLREGRSGAAPLQECLSVKYEQSVRSVVQIRAEDESPEAVGMQSVAALRHLGAQLEAGALVTIESDRTRLRLLPLKPEE